MSRSSEQAFSDARRLDEQLHKVESRINLAAAEILENPHSVLAHVRRLLGILERVQLNRRMALLEKDFKERLFMEAGLRCPLQMADPSEHEKKND